jgi:hypothetical protein
MAGAALLLLLGNGAVAVHANQIAPCPGTSRTPVSDADKQRLLATVDAQWEPDKRRP